MTEAEKRIREILDFGERTDTNHVPLWPNDVREVLAEIDRLIRELAEARAERDALAKAFLELHATVVGECPSLLNEDSGGSAVLIALVMDALAQIEKEKANGSR